MISSSENPRVLAKRKNIQFLIDYCLEQKVEFSVKLKDFTHDDYEVEVAVNSVKKAILFGMFLKENKLEVAGIPETAKPPQTSTKSSSKKEVIKSHIANTIKAELEQVTGEPDPNFAKADDESVLKF
jgi:hypothetical protein